ncbi:hypothetical protein CH253_13035 [Rhodococcus sp. 06-156-3C]|nr:hypothetical protein CH253_13035 [Rhodococcus sp. 06-156-3C]OZD24114.1 hypothetical protein CH248_06015 [Rhodococcus sp. 06-156-4a]OZD29413.1 hypothetical protein CH247_18130 [Rhodococcus sp. 06-156-3b]OZD29621.1 hypothetical protein CH284_25960 [Rhodococcus sp. 06-156-3]OZF59877.1 hypothetical protein CH290_18900 [Rhodococcus sp. 06-156-4]
MPTWAIVVVYLFGMDEGVVAIVVAIVAFLSTMAVTFTGAWIARRDRRANLERDIQVLKALCDLGGNTEKLARLVHRQIEDIGVELAVRQKYSRLIASAAFIVILTVSAIAAGLSVPSSEMRSVTVTALVLAVMVLVGVSVVQYGQCRHSRIAARGEYRQRDLAIEGTQGIHSSEPPHLASVDSVALES